MECVAAEEYIQIQHLEIMEIIVRGAECRMGLDMDRGGLRARWPCDKVLQRLKLI